MSVSAVPPGLRDEAAGVFGWLGESRAEAGAGARLSRSPAGARQTGPGAGEGSPAPGRVEA